MQPFICPECGEESTYDPWQTSAQCPVCGYVPPEKATSGYYATPEERQRIARLKSVRTWLTVLLMFIIPSLVVIGVFGILPRVGLEGRAAVYGLLGIIGGVIGLLFLPTIIALFIVERQIARQLTRAWRRLAGQLDLTFNPKGGPGRLPLGSVTGTYDGRPVEVFVQTKRRRVRTCATIALAHPVAGEIKLILAGNSGEEGQIPIREATFDQVATVEDSPEGFASEVLASPVLRERLLRIRRGSIIWLQPEVITLQQHAAYGIERDIPYLIAALETLSALASAAEAGSPPAPGLTES